MKKMIFIHGPNGIGKSTACEALHRQLKKSAWLESEWTRKINPFQLNDEIGELTEKNMTFLLRNYLNCSEVEYVIFNWGYHGNRKRIFEKVMKNISDLDFKYLPLTLKCDLEENIKRMKRDGRSEERIQRTIVTREIYEDLDCPSIDITALEVDETVKKIVEFITQSE